MNKKTVNVLVSGAVLVLAMITSGCVMLTKPAQYIKPTYDNSHAVLVEQTVATLPLTAVVEEVVRTSEKVMVASMETEFISDFGVNYIIEDNLIANLTQAGYVVVDRDPHVLSHISKEHTAANVYYQHLVKDNPGLPIFQLMQNLQNLNLEFSSPVEVRERLRTDGTPQIQMVVDTLSLEDIQGLIDAYAKLQSSYDTAKQQQISESSITPADVLVSYRVLECGLWVDIEQDQIDGNTATPRYVHTYNRHAATRLFVRIVDARTGEVRMAKLLESRKDDTVEFKQGEGETSAHYNNRMNEYNEMLKNYHFTFYDHQLPNKRGTAREQIEVLDRTGSEASVSSAPDGGASNVMGSATAGDGSSATVPGTGGVSPLIWILGGLGALLSVIMLSTL